MADAVLDQCAVNWRRPLYSAQSRFNAGLRTWVLGWIMDHYEAMQYDPVPLKAVHNLCKHWGTSHEKLYASISKAA